MKKLSTRDIIGIAAAAAATAAIAAGVVIIVKKCKKAIDAYEQEMFDAAQAEAEMKETAEDCICEEAEPVCEDTCEAPCACAAEPADEAVSQEAAEEEITE